MMYVKSIFHVATALQDEEEEERARLVTIFSLLLLLFFVVFFFFFLLYCFYSLSQLCVDMQLAMRL